MSAISAKSSGTAEMTEILETLIENCSIKFQKSEMLLGNIEITKAWVFFHQLSVKYIKDVGSSQMKIYKSQQSVKLLR